MVYNSRVVENKDTNQNFFSVKMNRNLILFSVILIVFVINFGKKNDLNSNFP